MSKYLPKPFRLSTILPYFPLILLFSFFAIYYVRYIGNLCLNLSLVGFDMQNFMTWYYAASNDILPYKDIFYPYGIISYYKTGNLFFTFLYFFQICLLLSLAWIVLRWLFASLPLQIGAFLTLFFFNEKFGSYNSIQRYSTSVFCVALFAYLLQRLGKNHFFTASAVCGAIAGLVFSGVYDQGIYVIIASSLFVIFYWHNKFRYILGYTLGFLVGMLPFLIYLLMHNMVNIFILDTIRLMAMTAYAKVPFYPSFFTQNHMFVFYAMITSSFYLAWSVFYNRKYFYTITGQLQALWLLLLLLFSSKNIVRAPIVDQYIFLGLLLYFVHIKNISTLRPKIIPRYSIIAVSLALFSYVFFYANLLPTVKNFSIISYKHITRDFWSQIQNGWNLTEVQQCVAENFNEKKLIVEPAYRNVQTYLLLQSDFNGKVFSFPADPLFYILLKQTPPRFFNLYDGSAKWAQEDNIKYIRQNNINYIIVNTKIIAIQDSVPDYVRGNVLFYFILRNYTLTTKLDQFLIFRKNQTNQPDDFLINPLLKNNDVADFQWHLFNPLLGAVPRSEGFYKSKKLQSNALQEITLPFQTKGTLLLIEGILDPNTPKTYGTESNSYVKLTTDNNIGIRIGYVPCVKGQMCIIDLDTIPAFVINRIITQVRFEEPNTGKLLIVKKPANANYLW